MYSSQEVKRLRQRVSEWPTIRELSCDGSNRNAECGHFYGYGSRLQLSLPPSKGNLLRYALGGTFPRDE